MNDETMSGYRALREGCGLVKREADVLAMRGEDRLRFLNGQLTCDVAALEPGSGRYGFVTTLKGRVMADVVVLAQGDELWLELPAGQSDAVGERLAKYVIVDRVELEPRGDVVPVTLIGPGTERVLGGELPAEPWSHVATRIGDVEARLVRDGRYGVVAATLWVDAGRAETLARALEERGATPADAKTLELLRVEEGRPRWGVDFDAEHFPQETGLEDEAVSYTKGCYLGQEVVARIHYRGGVNRFLRGLRLTAGDDDPRGGELLLEGRTVGRVGSVVESPRHGRIGLAVVHKRAEPGTVVELSGGGEAEVVELPFAAG